MLLFDLTLSKTNLFLETNYTVWYNKARKSAASIPANIAEGYGRRSTGDYIRFLNIAQGSVNELETHLLLSQRVKLSEQQNIEPIISSLREESRMIIALIKKLEQ